MSLPHKWIISRMNNHCLQQRSVNSARTENILHLTIRTWCLRSRSVKTFSKSICLARQLKYYLPSLVTISISHILGDTWPAFTRVFPTDLYRTVVFPKRAHGKSLGTRLGGEESLKRGKCVGLYFFPPTPIKQVISFVSFIYIFCFCSHIKILSPIFHWPSQCDRYLVWGLMAGLRGSWGRYDAGWPRHPSFISDAVVKTSIIKSFLPSFLCILLCT